ncbi:MAG: hypothetical protein U1G08_08770 [Verrucomicrobiota bacterium]
MSAEFESGPRLSGFRSKTLTFAAVIVGATVSLGTAWIHHQSFREVLEAGLQFFAGSGSATRGRGGQPDAHGDVDRPESKVLIIVNELERPSEGYIIMEGLSEFHDGQRVGHFLLPDSLCGRRVAICTQSALSKVIDVDIDFNRTQRVVIHDRYLVLEGLEGFHIEDLELKWVSDNGSVVHPARPRNRIGHDHCGEDCIVCCTKCRGDLVKISVPHSSDSIHVVLPKHSH